MDTNTITMDMIDNYIDWLKAQVKKVSSLDARECDVVRREAQLAELQKMLREIPLTPEKGQ